MLFYFDFDQNHLRRVWKSKEQHINFTSLVPWTYISWIRNLAASAPRICSMDKLPYEINTIKIFASWNGFPKSVVNSIISKILNAPFIAEDSHDTDETSNKVTIHHCVTYYDDKGFSSIKPYIHKIKSNCRKENQLHHSFPMHSFSTPWKQKTLGCA